MSEFDRVTRIAPWAYCELEVEAVGPGDVTDPLAPLSRKFAGTECALLGGHQRHHDTAEVATARRSHTTWTTPLFDYTNVGEDPA
jgi:hypothetical protein